MLKEISNQHRMLSLAVDHAHPVLIRESSFGRRVSEALPALISWLAILSPVWLTLLSPALGFGIVAASVAYFVARGTLFGARALLNRPRLQRAMEADWLRRLEQDGSGAEIDWRQCRVTLLIRAYREDNLQMLRDTLAAIDTSNWPRDGGRLRALEVVFATEAHDPITPPLVETLAGEFSDRLVVRQIKHPYEEGTLPGPSTAMHYVGRILYREAIAQGRSPQQWLVADLDCDTLLHPQYLPCLVYHFVTDSQCQRRVYQPLVSFTTDYWRAPLHSRLSAAGTTSLTVSWNRRPEVAFTGAAASLALLRSVDFWPTNSHSQDSGIDLRLRLRYSRRYRVVGLPVPLFVYPVMVTGQADSMAGRLCAYAVSFRVLFRQSARWREGPLDEFVEALRLKRPLLVLHRLWAGLERDVLTIIPGYGFLAARLTVTLSPSRLQPSLPWQGSEALTMAAAAALTIASLLGLFVFWLLLDPSSQLLEPVPRWRRVVELLSFWLVFGLYVPVLTGVAGLRTATAYLLGRRPRGHFSPTPK